MAKIFICKTHVRNSVSFFFSNTYCVFFLYLLKLLGSQYLNKFLLSCISFPLCFYSCLIIILTSVECVISINIGFLMQKLYFYCSRRLFYATHDPHFISLFALTIHMSNASCFFLCVYITPHRILFSVNIWIVQILVKHRQTNAKE